MSNRAGARPESAGTATNSARVKQTGSSTMRRGKLRLLIEGFFKNQKPNHETSRKRMLSKQLKDDPADFMRPLANKTI